MYILVCDGYLFLCQVLIGYHINVYMPIKSYHFKNPDPFPIRHFLKVNTCFHFITNDLKNLSIHNQTLLGENNKVGCFSKTWINNHLILGLCYLQIERKQFLQVFIIVINNQYAFLVVIGACTLK
jgi:hypothetical protein